MNKIIIIWFLFFGNFLFAEEIPNETNLIEEIKVGKEEIVNEEVLLKEKRNIIFEDTDDTVSNKIINGIKKNISQVLDLKILNHKKNIFDKIIEINKINEKQLENIILEKYKDVKVDIVISNYLTDGIVEGESVLSIILFDFNKKELLKSDYMFNKTNWQDISDIITDDILNIFVGENTIYFNTKILYISEKNNKRSIFLTNFNVSNDTQITLDNDLIATPIFSKTNRDEIFYIKLTEDGSFLFKYNIRNEIDEKIDIGEGIFAPNFSPILNEVVYSKGTNGITNIYKYNFDTKEEVKLTDSDLDLSPNYSPDGKNIVFISDRSGAKKIYTMDSDGNNLKVITKDVNYNTPIWSPSGDVFAFIRQKDKNFHIGLITVDGQYEKIIKKSYLIEGLKWSPNGRYLIYSKQEKEDDKIGIYTFDIINETEYKIPLPNDENILDPDWSLKRIIY